MTVCKKGGQKSEILYVTLWDLNDDSREKNKFNVFALKCKYEHLTVSYSNKTIGCLT